jgi:hypothetical protein
VFSQRSPVVFGGPQRLNVLCFRVLVRHHGVDLVNLRTNSCRRQGTQSIEFLVWFCRVPLSRTTAAAPRPSL